jgi:hypothetical protein
MGLRIAIAACLVAAAAVAAVVVSDGDGDGEDRNTVVHAASRPVAVVPGAPVATVRGCDSRIDGYVPPPEPHDTVIGPVAFKELPGSYRWSLRHPKVPIKSVAVLRAGSRVTLVVPRAQRGWLRLGYGAKAGAVTLRACRHLSSRKARRSECGLLDLTPCTTGPTLFAGGFAVAFDRAPKRGRCAELIVWVAGEDRPYRETLFAPSRCASEL